MQHAYNSDQFAAWFSFSNPVSEMLGWADGIQAVSLRRGTATAIATRGHNMESSAFLCWQVSEIDRGGGRERERVDVAADSGAVTGARADDSGWPL